MRMGHPCCESHFAVQVCSLGSDVDHPRPTAATGCSGSSGEVVAAARLARAPKHHGTPAAGAAVLLAQDEQWMDYHLKASGRRVCTIAGMR